MLLEYSIEQGWEVYNIYSDDNYTGSDRNRPEFVRLLEDAKARKFDIILCKSIHMEYFNFRNDSINRLLISHLAPKVKEGVEVRLLFDGFGNISNNQPMRRSDLDSIRAKGIEIYEFNPVRFPFINDIWSRDHRKIVVIDGLVAYTGGMNVADYYINGTPQVGEWHVRQRAAHRFLPPAAWGQDTDRHDGPAI